MAPNDDGFKNFVLDQLGDLQGVTCRAMFGGYGLSQRETFFGIIHKGRLYFKVTPATVSLYKEQGMKPFRPNAKQTLKSFYEVPVDVLEDREQLTAWGTEAVSNMQARGG
ncbi:MAG: TfoX/Sxy family protein [Nitrospira sp. CG24E]|nr:MAG: TfoX/Sxy family protein [Nitrospira sp. CG24E]